MKITKCKNIFLKKSLFVQIQRTNITVVQKKKVPLWNRFTVEVWWKKQNLSRGIKCQGKESGQDLHFTD